MSYFDAPDKRTMFLPQHEGRLSAEQEIRGCCAHLTVRYKPIEWKSGLLTARWKCDDCEALFSGLTHFDDGTKSHFVGEERSPLPTSSSELK